MMTCTNCKKQIPADSAFCPFCGMIIAESKSGTQIQQHEEVMTGGDAFAIPEGKRVPPEKRKARMCLRIASPARKGLHCKSV